MILDRQQEQSGEYMTDCATDYLVVGGGLSAVTAVETLVKRRRGRVRLVSAEHYLPYSRPPLSKVVLAGEAGPSSVLLKTPEFFRDKQVEVMLGDPATELDPCKRVITLASGRQILYGKVLLATGVVPARLDLPGISLPGVHTLRNLTDALALSRQIGPGRTVVIIGGGFIGCEVASTAVARGAQVCVVEPGTTLMERALGPEVGRLLTAYQRRAGVGVYLGTHPVRICGERRAETVVLNSGAVLPCDTVVVGVGTYADTSWLAGAGIELSDGGIVVDSGCRTSDPDVYAAGDVAARYEPLLNQYVRCEHESNAQQQGVIAARNMAGGSSADSSLPFVWSRQFGLDLWCIGQTRSYDCVEIAGRVEDRSLVAIYHLKGKPVGVFGLDGAAMGAARNLLRGVDSKSAETQLLGGAKPAGRGPHSDMAG
ncbi:NAD(P)/FAD-dependent oxidoreductase [Mycobacterium vicinigordonae]|uniref:FAD-dependent oxidoreductase n=1 Tax=Mycobacterium vicinigordonae TaxID=1719132 RepID=A0A7D6I9B9_9MYCO|nr:NAD(P)/FAD-dependent oxidoreductase [Mycobacterium vicinigordonae]QLL07877.1 FAD-dependent oxidoreductase [Mycobacterium vicinigordonae]